MKFELKHFVVKNFWKTLFTTFFAIVFMGVALSFLIQVGWGSDPYTFMNLNISSCLGWTLGNWQFLCNAVLLLNLVFFAWELVGFGTIFNMVLIGYTADFSNWIWKKTGVEAFIQSGDFLTHLFVFIPAILLFVFFAAVYMNQNMGLSPYDGPPKIIAPHIKKLPFAITRIIYDLLFVLIGFIASFFCEDGMQGSAVGSIVTALLLGPAISAVGAFLKRKE